MGLFDEKDLAEISDPAYPEERLIACKNPILAEERARKREDFKIRIEDNGFHYERDRKRIEEGSALDGI